MKLALLGCLGKVERLIHANLALAELGAVDDNRFMEADGTLWTTRETPSAAARVMTVITDRLGE